VLAEAKTATCCIGDLLESPTAKVGRREGDGRDPALR